ncbi:MAG: PAS domain S-box protein [Ilumatobacter sp.]|uniref:PAS domain S-box protein n=1 Tax=Ilumatobacter sp. TaxID=1967498 RepID=UPI00262FC62F|nr:PAS domain S-box protein [Ilumatobacter sp.]MDJ0769949.1 PAS domain S-box protein [Ilumatobacter sp.]
MPAAPLPHDEADRLAALRRLGILDTPSEERFDRLVRVASTALGMPIALVSLIDQHRQWFKARVGLDATETPREQAFCAHAITNPGETLVVPDATQDERFADNPLVTDDPNIRFYAGRVVHGTEGQPLGTLCVIDREPRQFDAHDNQVLCDLAELVEEELAQSDRNTVVMALERSERSKATLLHALEEGLVVQDATGRIVEWNRAATELLGLSDDELAGRTSIDPRWRAVHVDGRPWPGEDHPAMEALRTGEPVSDRTMGVHRPDSSLVWLRVNSRPIRDRDGHVTSVLTLFADVVATFDNERASETMTLRLRQAIESSGIGTAILDGRGSTMFVNDAYTDILGLGHHDLLGRTPTVWIHPDDPQYGGRGFDELGWGDSVRLTTEIRVLGHDRRDRWVRAHLTRLVDRSTTDRFVLQLEDVTERRRLADALRSSEELARASLDSLEQGVVLADATGAIHQINPAAERILGHTADELTAAFRSGTWETYDEHGKVKPRDQRPIRRVMDTREAVRSEILGWRHSAGHLVLLRLSCVPIPDADGVEGRFVVAFADVTDQHRAERLVDATFAMAPVGLALVDDERSVVRCNPTFATHAGGNGEDPGGQALDALLDIAGDAPREDGTGAGLGDELHLAADDGTQSWIETRSAEIDDFDRSMRIVATFDVTARKQLELDLQRFSHLFENANDIITVVDPTGQVLYASPSNERVLGYPFGWRSPGGILDLVHPDDLPATAAEFEALRAGARGSDPFTMRVRSFDGEWKHIETIGTNLVDEPSVKGIVLTSRDVTERQQLSAELAHRASHDPLTDLPNRAAAEERLADALRRTPGDRRLVGVCYLDLDGFKTVNDTLGHAAGDEVIVDVGRRLADGVRESDLPARFGGDEFVVVLDQLPNAERAVAVARRLWEDLTTPPLRSGDVPVGVSVGIAVSQPDDTVDSLLSRADTALYRAKSSTTSKVILYEGLDVPSVT